MAGGRNRTKLRKEVGTMEKFKKEKEPETGPGSMETSGGGTKETEAARLEIGGEFDSFMEKILREYTEKIEKLMKEMREMKEVHGRKREREKERAE